MKKSCLYGERTFFISGLLLYCPGAFILHLPLLVIAALSESCRSNSSYCVSQQNQFSLCFCCSLKRYTKSAPLIKYNWWNCYKMSIFENYIGLPTWQRYSHEYSSHFSTIITKQKEECPSSSPSDCTSKTIIFTYSFKTLSNFFSSYIYMFYPNCIVRKEK